MKLFWAAKPIKNLRLKNHYGGSNHIKKFIRRNSYNQSKHTKPLHSKLEVEPQNYFGVD